MPARSTRWRPACCRSRSARRPRPCPTSWTAASAIASRVRWGEARDTDDAEGEITATSDVRPTAAAIARRAAALHRRRSSRCRRPSRRSRSTAGAPMTLARAGEAGRSRAAPGARSPSFDLGRDARRGSRRVRGDCGKGTYIRGLGPRPRRGASAPVGHYRRTAPPGGRAVHRESTAISLERRGRDRMLPQHLLLPVETALDDIPALALTETRPAICVTGRPVRLLDRADASRPRTRWLCAMFGGRPVALGPLRGRRDPPDARVRSGNDREWRLRAGARHQSSEKGDPMSITAERKQELIKEYAVKRATPARPRSRSRS